jgi:hypothetical protein
MMHARGPFSRIRDKGPAANGLRRFLNRRVLIAEPAFNAGRAGTLFALLKRNQLLGIRTPPILKGVLLMKQEEGVASRAKVEARNKVDEAKNMAKDIAEDAKRQGHEKIESGKERAASQTEKLAGVVERAAQDLKDGELGPLSDYAGQLANGMKTFAENIRSKNLDELLNDTQQLARKNPGLFFIGSVAIGLGISRFVKASGERSQGQNAEREYPLTAQSTVQPAAFKSNPAVVQERGSANPESSENSSFADDLNKGV